MCRKYDYPSPSCCPCLPFDIYPWLVLFCLCWVTFGSYWVFDTPGAIQSQLTAWFGGRDKYTNGMNDLLYSVYSYPNFVLAFFGGFIMDRWFGLRLGTLIFCGLVLAGQVVFALGIQFRNYYTCVAGRLIFGLGGESLTVGQNAYTAKWFDGSQLALALGLVVAFSRIGSSVNFAVTPIFAQIGVPMSVWFGTGMCLVSFAACVAVGLLDWKGEARIAAKKGIQEKEPEPVNLSAILHFPASSWVIFLICMFFYISVLTFYTAAAEIMEHSVAKYSPETASFFIFIPNFVAIFAAPVFGKLIDKFGRALWVLLVSSAMMVVAHLVFMAMFLDWFFIHPAITMVWIGLGYSLFASSIWPTLPNIIRESNLGTAYGAMTAVQNLGLGLGPQIVGWIQDASSISGTRWEWVIPLIFFMCCAGMSFLLSFVLLIIDARIHGGVLNGTGEQKLEAQKYLNSTDVATIVTETSPLINPSS